jgi:hypothetical protein
MTGSANTTASPDAARAIAAEAYIYAYPMLDNYATWFKQAVDSRAPEYVGGFGRFRHYSEPSTPQNHDVVTPNNDTPYSWAWLDLRAEPWVMSVPEVPSGRYYVSQWVDLFTYNFAYVGSRTTGNGAGHYLFAGPRWDGEAPAGVDKVFRAETDIIGTLTRTQLDGPEDVAAVRAVQAGLTLQPLSAFLEQPPPPSPPKIDFPPYDAERAHSHDFIAYLNFLMQFAEPPDPSEVELRERFGTIGIGPGWDWNGAALAPALLEAIDAGVQDAKAAMAARLALTLSSNGLFGTRQDNGNDYMMRAVAANKGMYGNSIDEAWYGGYVGDGARPATIYFAPGQLPQARFFWSITLYTLPDRFLYDNAINRYSIGDRTKGLKTDADGSLTLHVSHESPGPELESNWLPAPEGKYSLVARIYGPSKEARRGEWKLPSLQY